MDKEFSSEISIPSSCLYCLSAIYYKLSIRLSKRQAFQYLFAHVHGSSSNMTICTFSGKTYGMNQIRWPLQLTARGKEFGLIILFDALGRQRSLYNIDNFLA